MMIVIIEYANNNNIHDDSFSLRSFRYRYRSVRV